MAQKYSDYASEYVTEIPLIQRDYVQGADVNAEKRDAFLTVLLDAMAEKKDSSGAATRGDLDFLYGVKGAATTSGTPTFAPIDGQQRLTTLFLIGRALSWKYPEGKHSPFSMLYKTRHSTEQFCRKLIETSIPKDLKGKPSEYLERTELWMSARWKADPSVAAMLDMLDTIWEKLSEPAYRDKIEDMADRFFTDSPVVFEKLEIDKFDLSDDLYIKMNARGKFLTPFENWKAEMLGMLRRKFRSVSYPYATVAGQTLSIPEYFSYAIEHQWCDLLWEKAYRVWDRLPDDEKKHTPYPRIDEFFMRLLDYLCEMIFSERYSDKEFERMARLCDVSSGELFSGKKTHSAPDGKWLPRRRIKVWRSRANIEMLMRILDKLVEIDSGHPADTGNPDTVGHGHIQTFFDTLFYSGFFSETDERVRLFGDEEQSGVNLFDNCISGSPNFTIPDKMMLRAILHYCLRHNVATADTDLLEYVRVYRGWQLGRRQRLTKGMIVRFNLRVDDYRHALRTADQLAQDTDVYKTLSNIGQPYATELSEEIRKASWRNSSHFQDIRILANAPELRGDLGNLHDAFLALPPQESPLRCYIDRFRSLSDTQRIIALVNHGFKGLEGLAKNYRFFGKRGNTQDADHWTYCFATPSGTTNPTDATFRGALKNLLTGQPAQTFGLHCREYYMTKYPQFWQSVNDERKSHASSGNYIYIGTDRNFTLTAMADTFSQRPLNGYNVDPYAYVVRETAPTHVRTTLDLYCTGFGSDHGTLELRALGIQMECIADGWRISLIPGAQLSQQSKWGIRFSLDGPQCADTHGDFTFADDVLSDLKDKDRIETAIDFLSAISDLL